MLFKFGKFWKTLFFTAFTWVAYTTVGFELTVVTLMALIYSNSFKTDNVFL
jgi:hypothetical protein